MEITGTREAFAAMIQERGIFKKLGVERSTVSTWKIYLREGKSISLDKMEEMLLKSGAFVLCDKIWSLVEIKGPNFGIPINELRVGNIVSRQGHVRSLNRMDMSRLLSEDKLELMDICQPVQITEGWLNRFGLDKKIIDSDNNSYYLTEMADANNKIYWAFFRNNERLKNLSFVHQIQNLFFVLTDEELMIKEPGL